MAAPNVAAKKQAAITVGKDWRKFEPLELLPSLEGARKVFPARGYHGASVRDIAEAAGITVPTLYYYHGNKEAMLRDLLILTYEELLERVARARADTPSDVVSQFKCFVEVAVLQVTHRQAFATLESDLRFLEPESRVELGRLRRTFESQLMDLLREGIESGDFVSTHPRETCRAVLGMIQAIATWYNPDGELSPDEIAARYVSIALRVVRRTS